MFIAYIPLTGYCRTNGPIVSYWTAGKFVSGAFKWEARSSSSNKVEHTNWTSGYPKNVQNNEDCIAVWSKKAVCRGWTGLVFIHRASFVKVCLLPMSFRSESHLRDPVIPITPITIKDANVQDHKIFKRVQVIIQIGSFSHVCQ